MPALLNAKPIHMGGYKRLGYKISFADLAVERTLEHNLSVKLMEKINAVVKWNDIEAMLMEYY